MVTGLTYAKAPITAGAEIGIIDTQGDARLVGFSQRHEYEIAFGGTYTLAPGVLLVGEYMYTHRHQGGFDFATGTLGQTTAGVVNGRTNDAKGQGLRLRDRSNLVTSTLRASKKAAGPHPAAFSSNHRLASRCLLPRQPSGHQRCRQAHQARDIVR